MSVARAVLAALAAMRADPEHRTYDGSDPNHCPDCGDTGCVPQDWTEGGGFKACPRGCAQIADEPEGGT